MNPENDTHNQPTLIHDKAAQNIESIRADRACIQCGFNLFGQAVVKEEHYQLAIARCPECGTVAALQSYPTMSHWVNRFRALIAGAWVVALLFAFVIQILIVGSFADSLSRTVSDPLAKEIGKAYYTWAEENGTTTSITGWATTPEAYYQWVSIPSDWVDEHLDEIVAEFGGLWNDFDRLNILFVIPAWIVAFLTGVFWSVVLLGASPKRAAIVPTAASVLIIVLAYVNFSPPMFFAHQASEIAKDLYVSVLTPIAMLIQFPVILLGVFLGRKIARFVIQLTLPPRSRVPFSIFWTRDGLDLPKPNFK